MFLIDAQVSSDNPQRLGMAANRIVPALVVVAPERWEPRKRPRIPKHLGWFWEASAPAQEAFVP